jgi:hypothetical protein
MPCHEYAVLKANSQGHGTARHVGDLPAFGEWQSRGRGTEWERHGGMCELTFNAAGERHGRCESGLTDSSMATLLKRNESLNKALSPSLSFPRYLCFSPFSLRTLHKLQT